MHQSLPQLQRCLDLLGGDRHAAQNAALEAVDLADGEIDAVENIFVVLGSREGGDGDLRKADRPAALREGAGVSIQKTLQLLELLVGAHHVVGELHGVDPSDDLTYRRNGRLQALVLMNEPHRVRQARADLKEAA